MLQRIKQIRRRLIYGLLGRVERFHYGKCRATGFGDVSEIRKPR